MHFPFLHEFILDEEKIELAIQKKQMGKFRHNFYQVQNKSGNGVDIVAQNSLTGDIIIAEVKSTQQLRLWDNGNMKDLPLSADQKAGGENYSNDRLNRAAKEEDGYTDGQSSANAKEAQKAIRAAEENGANVEYYKYDVYVDENGAPRAEPKQRPWEAPFGN